MNNIIKMKEKERQGQGMREIQARKLHYPDINNIIKMKKRERQGQGMREIQACKLQHPDINFP